ncbi:MAG: hypothetical protein K2G36_06150, partial [Ruminococcus sp.]|nr:hypothetical protein [Ruminococcus sp.]
IASYAGVKLLCDMFYGNVQEIPLIAFLIFGILAVVSVCVSLVTIKQFVSGIFRGMNHIRRIALFLKITEFITIGIIMIKNIINWR